MPEFAIIGIMFLVWKAFDGAISLYNRLDIEYRVWKMDREWKKRNKNSI